MRPLNVFNLPNPFTRSKACDLLNFQQKLVPEAEKKVSGE
jgi:hypothetical protein